MSNSNSAELPILKALNEVRHAQATAKRDRYFTRDDLERTRSHALALAEMAGWLLEAVHNDRPEKALDIERQLRLMLRHWNGVASRSLTWNEDDRIHLPVVTQIQKRSSPVSLSSVSADSWCEAAVLLARELCQVFDEQITDFDHEHTTWRVSWERVRSKILQGFPQLEIEAEAELQKEFDDLKIKLQNGDFEPTAEQLLDRCATMRRMVDTNTVYVRYGGASREIAELWEDLRRLSPKSVLPPEPNEDDLQTNRWCQNAINTIIAAVTESKGLGGDKVDMQTNHECHNTINTVIAVVTGSEGVGRDIQDVSSVPRKTAETAPTSSESEVEATTGDAEDSPADETETADDELPAAKRKLYPSRLKAKALYEWAMSAIPNAEAMTINELYAAIEAHPSVPSDALPTNADTFGKYLRDAGIKRYSARGGRTGGSVQKADSL